jgi:hypothetical protein
MQMHAKWLVIIMLLLGQVLLHAQNFDINNNLAPNGIK